MRMTMTACAAAMILGSCTGPLVQTVALPAIGDPDYYADGPRKVIKTYSLPQAFVPIRVSVQKCKATISLEPTVYMPDPDHRYAIIYTPNPSSDDTLSVETDAGDLLMAVNTTSQTRTPEIAVEAITLAQTIAAIAGGSPLISSTDEKPKPACDVNATYDVVYTFDPSKKDTLRAAALNISEDLRKFGITVDRYDVTPILPSFADADGVMKYPGNVSAAECVGGAHSSALRGICYRPAQTYRVSLTVRVMAPAGPSITARQFAVTAPDMQQIYYIPINRKIFTQYNVKLTFQKGMLTKFDSTDNSETLAALKVPSTVIKAIVGLNTAPAKK